MERRAKQMVRARPRVALIMTTWHESSHADVIGRRLLDGYDYLGVRTMARVEVVSAYLEQLGVRHPNPRPDVGVEVLDRHGIPRFSTVAEALGLGGPGLAVDGVIIVGEHGDYELNEFGQKLYPRRRLFDAAVSTMIAAGRFVPVFVDKHLAWSTPDAIAMYVTAGRLGIPLAAGSSAPVAVREPVGADWPRDAVMTDCLAVGYGEIEAYGFHALEAAQCIAERRAGGESGVASVSALGGDAARAAVADGRVDPDLFARALSVVNLDGDQSRQAAQQVKAVFWVEHSDGLRETVVMTDAVSDFLVAARGPRDELAIRMVMGGEQPSFYPHFGWLVRQIESLMMNGAAPYPVERTLLTGGILDAAMQSLSKPGKRITPELAISYRVPDGITDTGFGMAASASI